MSAASDPAPGPAVSITPGPARGAAATSPHPIQVLGEVVATVGVLVLLFVPWQLWWTDLIADRQAAELVVRSERAWAAAGASPDGAGSGGPPQGVLAVIRIPRLGAGWARPLLEGTTAAQLDVGLGHYPGTALPGRLGNLAIAGHRTTHGRPLRDIDRLVAGDVIDVRTATVTYRYVVLGHEVVDPWRADVAAPDPDHPDAAPAAATRALLTLTSCHPVYSARERWVVHAVLDGIVTG